MGDVVPFARHTRTSARSRASSASKRSAVTPAPLARSVATIDAHHSEGILSRCDHLRTRDTFAPISAAMLAAAGEGHSSMIERNELTCVDIESALGQIVLNGKAILSRDCGLRRGQDVLMQRRKTETEEKNLFIARVRAAREARYATQGPMVTILDLDQGTYKQYETRTPLPYRYVPKFCAATGVSMVWLLTGDGKGPEVMPLPEKKPRAKKAKKRVAA